MKNFVSSKDGTRINYLKFGQGPGIIIIPGALTVAADYEKLAQLLAAEFSVYVIERRGRGKSGPQGKNYSVVSETEDLLALQKVTGAQFIFGHSFGGFVALESAIGQPKFTRIAVYEPGVLIDNSINMSWIPNVQLLLSKEKYHDAFTTFVKVLDPKSSRLPHWFLSKILKFVLKKPELEQKYLLLPGSILEHQEEKRLADSQQRYANVTANVLCMYGGGSGKAAKFIAEKLHEVIPSSIIRAYPKLNHLAPEVKPTAIAKDLINFFKN